MHSIVRKRKHGSVELETIVIVDKDGNPSVTFDFDDFINALCAEMPNVHEAIKNNTPSMTWAFTKKSADKNLDISLKATNIEGIIRQAAEAVIKRMKTDLLPLAKHVS
jgi:hypothetical protein